MLSLQATSLCTSKASNVFSICEATNGRGGGGWLGVSLLLQYGDDHMQTSRAAFFLLAKLSVLAKRNFQMTKTCLFWVF
jgi:hypothetical protein